MKLARTYSSSLERVYHLQTIALHHDLPPTPPYNILHPFLDRYGFGHLCLPLSPHLYCSTSHHTTIVVSTNQPQPWATLSQHTCIHIKLRPACLGRRPSQLVRSLHSRNGARGLGHCFLTLLECLQCIRPYRRWAVKLALHRSSTPSTRRLFPSTAHATPHINTPHSLMQT